MSGIVGKIAEADAQPETPRVPEKQIETIENKSSKAEPPLTEYINIKGHPYTVEYFDISFWNKLRPDFDPENTIKNVGIIEDYVSSEIEKREWASTPQSYRDIIDPIKDFIHMDDNISVGDKIDKIINYINITDRIKKENEKLNRLKTQLNKITGNLEENIIVIR